MRNNLNKQKQRVRPTLIPKEELWIADVVGNKHVTFSKKGLYMYVYDTRDENEFAGDLYCAHNNVNMTIPRVSYSENAKVNLFSIPAALKSGWKLCGSSKALTLHKGSGIIKFNNLAGANNKGPLYCARIKRVEKLPETSMMTKHKTGGLNLLATVAKQVLDKNGNHLKMVKKSCPKCKAKTKAKTALTNYMKYKAKLKAALAKYKQASKELKALQK